jgi:hypothetical protein
MVTTFKWVAGEGAISALTTQLNSLADAGFSAASSAIDNLTDLYIYMDLEVNLASFTPGAGGPYIAVYIIYSLDGTNYEKTPDGSSGDKAPIAIFPLEASVAQASRVTRTGIMIAPLKFKLVLENQAGAALAASGSTLQYNRHNGQSV